MTVLFHLKPCLSAWICLWENLNVNCCAAWKQCIISPAVASSINLKIGWQQMCCIPFLPLFPQRFSFPCSVEVGWVAMHCKFGTSAYNKQRLLPLWAGGAGHSQSWVVGGKWQCCWRNWNDAEWVCIFHKIGSWGKGQHKGTRLAKVCIY